MLYSSASFLAFIIHLIINHDVIWGNATNKIIPSIRSYRRFLLALSIYFVTDILWGILYGYQLLTLTYIDTVFYFAAMTSSILLWTYYAVDYLHEKNLFGKSLKILGKLLFCFDLSLLAVNFFYPVMFTFDEAGGYHSLTGRYISLAVQVAMFLFTALYVFFISLKRTGALKLRNRAIGIFSVSMCGFSIAQICFSLLPLYGVGCLLGSCLLHSFVLENEKEEYKDKLELKLQENILKGNYYDLLTGLPGMTYFFELTQKKRKQAESRGKRTNYLYLNLSGMKFYNQEHGFVKGDQLLRAFANLLTSTFGRENCCRLGQDHFAAFSDDDGLDDRLRQMFAAWKEQPAGVIAPPVLVGIYQGPDGLSPSTAYDLAKIACDAIQAPHVSAFQYYDSEMYTTAEMEQYITSHLDQAIAEKWIQVYYQPIVRAANRRVCDEEALARWIDPQRGMIPPSKFVPILENANLSYKLDLYVLEQVLEKNRRLQAAGLYLVPQSINLSRSDFDACDIVEELRKRTDAASLPHSMITVEITESITGKDFDYIKSQVERFRALGFPVWMDDFGSGYSSLDVLQSLPVDLIKLDMRFMQQFDHGDKCKVILTELMKMAIGLGIDTVCEGVEREDQVEFLREIGCAKLQGYYYAKPMPMEQIMQRYEKGIQIGFENPEESSYFDAIGRINLYDLASIAPNNDDAHLTPFFNTLPMAILELQKGQSHFVRSNSAYREFMNKHFYLSLASEAVLDETNAHGKLFLDNLWQSTRTEGLSLFDDILPGGLVIRYLVRRIAENSVTGKIAVVVVILSALKG